MKTRQSQNLYKVMQRFADITMLFIIQGNMKRAECCLNIADKLLVRGNLIIKNAVANVYVYSLSRILDRRDARAIEVMKILPFSIRNEYDQQVNSSGV